MRHSKLFLILISLLLFATSSSQAADDSWAANFGPTGVDGTVLATIQWGDSTVVAGNFSRLANYNNLTSEFAIFDNIDRSWKLIDNGPNGEIRSMAISDNGDLILAGEFTLTYAGKTMDNLTVFGKDGSWNTLSGESEDFLLSVGPINDILWVDGKLVIGGEFPIGGSSKALIVWDPSFGFQLPFENLNSFRSPNPIIRSLSYSTYYSKLFVGGDFLYDGLNGTSPSLAWFDIENLEYHAVESPIDGPINVIMTDSNSHWWNRLVVGGEFDEIWNFTDSGLTVDSCGNVMILDLSDSTWECIGNGVNGPVFSLFPRGDANQHLNQLIVGGDFDSSGTILTGPLSLWNDASSNKYWGRFNPDLNEGAVYSISVDPGFTKRFVIGGSFEYLDDSARVNNIFTTTSGSFWRAYGDGLLQVGQNNVNIHDVDVNRNGAYVVGGFTHGGGLKLNNVGRWSFGSWKALGDGVTGPPTEIIVSGDTVYVAGRTLTSASGLPVNQIAMWDGTQWNALGQGVPGANILDMELDTLGNLYVCGSSLTTAGNVSVNGIAKWNGSSWETVGEPLISNSTQVYLFDMYIDSLTNNLFVCGQVELVGPNADSCYGVAMWDGTEWQALGMPLFLTSGTPRTITRNSDGDLVIAGTYAGNWIYKKSGNGNWNAYGGIVGGTAASMLSVGCNLYLSGQPIVGINSDNFRNIARFDGLNWTGLDSGANNHILAMSDYSNDLYVVGKFDLVGDGILAKGFTYWQGLRDQSDTPLFTNLTHNQSDTMFYGQTVAISWADDPSITSLSFQYSLNNGSNWNSVDGNIDLSLGAFIWEVPSGVNSDSVYISLSAGNGCYNGTLGPYIMRHVPGLNVQRIYRVYPNGKKTAFNPKVHGWQFSNSGGNQWPQSYIDDIDYTTLPPLTRAQVEQFEKGRSLFQDWKLFVKTWGADLCYHDFGPNLYALMKWSGRQKVWGGSCVGFTTTAQSFFDHDRTWWNLSEHFPDYRFVNEIPIDSDSREMVNIFQARWRGSTASAYSGKLAFNDVSSALDSLLTFFGLDGTGIDGVHPQLSMWPAYYDNDDKLVVPVGHSVFPYKVTNVPDSTNIVRIYVYDSNRPYSTESFVRINLDDSTWAYDPMGWSSNIYLVPGPPFQSGHDSKLFYKGQATSQNPLYGQRVGDTLIISLETSEWNDILITTPANDSLGQTSSGGLVINPDFGSPVIPPGPHFSYLRPPEYLFPDTNATIELSNFDSSHTFLTWNHDSVIYNFERDSIVNSQTDLLEFDDAWMYTNPDNSTKSIQLRTTAAKADFSWIMEMQNISMALNDSLSVVVVGDSLKIKNIGVSKSVGLHIIVSGDTSIDEIQSDSVTISNDATVTIIPDWTNLDYETVLVLTDADGDDLYEDTASLDVATSVGDNNNNQLPNSFQLGQNYPNPFNPQTTIEFSLPTASDVTINIYNLLGQKVKTVLERAMPAGKHSIIWDGSTDSGQRVSSGIYFYRLKTDGFVSTKKMLLLK